MGSQPAPKLESSMSSWRSWALGHSMELWKFMVWSGVMATTRTTQGSFVVSQKKCSSHKYRESVAMGETKMSKAEVDELILKLKATWPGFEYDLLRHNCVIFSSFFCEQLGVGAIPSWVTNLCGAGETLVDCSTAKAFMQA